MQYHPDDRIPEIAPLAGDDRLRSGGFRIARRPRVGLALWSARGSLHLWTALEAFEAMDLLQANHFSRDGYGGYTFEGETFTTIEAIDFVARVGVAQHAKRA